MHSFLSSPTNLILLQELAFTMGSGLHLRMFMFQLRKSFILSELQISGFMTLSQFLVIQTLGYKMGLRSPTSELISRT